MIAAHAISERIATMFATLFKKAHERVEEIEKHSRTIHDLYQKLEHMVLHVQSTPAR